MQVGTVDALWRFPVKSLGGESVPRCQVGARGLAGDRLWAVRDVAADTLTNAKRIPALLLAEARWTAEPAVDAEPGSIPDVVVRFPDGHEAASSDPRIHDRLSELAGRRVELCRLRPADDHAHYRSARATAADMAHDFAIEPGQAMPDFSMMPTATLLALARHATPPGTYFDAATLHVVTTASLRALGARADADVRRFRSNLIVDTAGADGWLETAWVAGRLTAGACVARVDCPTPRCAMPTHAQPGLARSPETLRALVAATNRCLGIYASVEAPGTIAVGDPVRFAPPSAQTVRGWGRAGATAVKRLLLRAAIPKR